MANIPMSPSDAAKMEAIKRQLLAQTTKKWLTKTDLGWLMAFDPPEFKAYPLDPEVLKNFTSAYIQMKANKPPTHCDCEDCKLDRALDDGTLPLGMHLVAEAFRSANQTPTSIHVSYQIMADIVGNLVPEESKYLFKRGWKGITFCGVPIFITTRAGSPTHVSFE